MQPPRHIAVTAAFLAAVLPLFGAPPQGYVLRWEDHFDGLELDKTKWGHRSLGPRRDAVNVVEAVSLTGAGTLKITTSKVGDEYHTGMIGTQGKFERAFGYWEARIKLQDQEGHWSAFWLQSPTVGNPIGNTMVAGTEIDIVEYHSRWGDGLQHALHWDGYGEFHKSTSKQTTVTGLADGFHTFGVKWTPDEYVFYTDGIETWRTSTALSHRTQYAILSLEVGTWAGNIANATLPDSMEVDYVRWYAPVTTPVAEDTSVTTVKDQAKSITLTATDPNGDALTYSIVNDPNNGTLDVSALPDVVYTPNPGYVGTDSFTFKANDGAEDSAPATISITIAASNATPVINAGTDQTVTLDGTSTPVFVQDGGAQGLVSVEAEHFHRNTAGGSDQWVERSETAASNGKSMDTNLDDGTNTNPAPQLSFDVSFNQSETHYIWIRGRAFPRSGSEGNADSVHAGFNGELLNSTTAITGFGASYGWSNALMAGGVASIDVPRAGVHSVEVFMREDGFVFDKMILTTDSSYTPTVNGVAESEIRNIVETTFALDGSSVTDSDGDTLSHSWTVVSAPTDGMVVLDDPNRLQPIVTLNKAGEYVLRLTSDDGIVTASDEIRITVNDTSNTLANWISGYDLGGLTGMDDDYDNDGLANGIENYFGTHPGAANPGIRDSTVQSVGSATEFRFEHPLNDNPASDISVRYRWSKDLATFHEDGATDAAGTTVRFTQGAPVNGMVTVTATIEGSTTDRVFVQLVVTPN